MALKGRPEDLPKNDGKTTPSKLGINDASTFLGFCEKHDGEMFRPVEYGQISLDHETLFLLSFRALSYELYAKRGAARLLDLQKESDRGKPFEAQAEIQQYLHWHGAGVKMGLGDLERYKTEYDNAYINNTFTRYHHYGVLFDTIIPLVACGGFYPEVDFAGNSLQHLGPDNTTPEHINFNLTVLNGQSIAVFGWLHDGNGPAKRLADSFKALPAEDKANAAIRLAMNHLENCFARLSWWQGHNTDAQKAIEKHLRAGLPGEFVVRADDALKDDGISYFKARAVSELEI